MILILLLLATWHLIQCGGKKKKKILSDKAPSGITPAKSGKPPVSRASEIPTALRSKEVEVEKPSAEKPATPATPPEPPKPVIAEGKVAEMLPDSPPKSDEMKEGIKLPAARAMKCEGDVEESQRVRKVAEDAKKAAEEEKKNKKKKGSKEKGSKEKAKSPDKEKNVDEII